MSDTLWFGTPGQRYGLDYVPKPRTEGEAAALIERYGEASVAFRANRTTETSDAYVTAYRELLNALKPGVWER